MVTEIAMGVTRTKISKVEAGVSRVEASDSVTVVAVEGVAVGEQIGLMATVAGTVRCAVAIVVNVMVRFTFT